MIGIEDIIHHIKSFLMFLGPFGFLLLVIVTTALGLAVTAVIETLQKMWSWIKAKKQVIGLATLSESSKPGQDDWEQDDVMPTGNSP